MVGDFSKIYFNSEFEEFSIPEACLIREIFKDPKGSVSLAEARLLPGEKTLNHKLSVDEFYYIRSGKGTMFLESLSSGTVGAGDIVHIKKGSSQYICNSGTEDLIFLCICLPVFTNDCYISVD